VLSFKSCGYAQQHWVQFGTIDALKDKTLSVTIPDMWYPVHYKSNADGEVYNFSGAEYYNNSVPWQGWMIDYMNAIVDMSGATGLNYTFRTGGSDKAMPESVYSAAVYDVGSGLSDLAVSVLWITSDRLLISPFTMPVAMDDMYLWIREPTIDNSWNANARKILNPFEPSLWAILVGLVFLMGALTAWFADPEAEHHIWYDTFRNNEWKRSSFMARATTLLMVVLQSSVEQAHFLFGGDVSHDLQATASQKILSFGYSFLVLIVVATYTANLAAFLTLSGANDYISSMNDAIDKGVSLCVHEVLMTDLKIMWPKATFVNASVHEDPYVSMLEDYDNNLCSAIVTGLSDIRNDVGTMKKFCERNLVKSGEPVLEFPLGFPIKKEYMAAISHLIYRGQKQEKKIAYASFQQNRQPPLPNTCSLDLSIRKNNADELLAMTPLNFALPIALLLFCAIISTVAHVVRAHYHGKARRNITNHKPITSITNQKPITSTKACKFTEKDRKMPMISSLSDLNSTKNLCSSSVQTNTGGKFPVLPPFDDLLTDKSDAMRSLQMYQHDLFEAIMKEKKGN